MQLKKCIRGNLAFVFPIKIGLPGFTGLFRSFGVMMGQQWAGGCGGRRRRIIEMRRIIGNLIMRILESSRDKSWWRKLVRRITNWASIIRLQWHQGIVEGRVLSVIPRVMIRRGRVEAGGPRQTCHMVTIHTDVTRGCCWGDYGPGGGGVTPRTARATWIWPLGGPARWSWTLWKCPFAYGCVWDIGYISMLRLLVWMMVPSSAMTKRMVMAMTSRWSKKIAGMRWRVRPLGALEMIGGHSHCGTIGSYYTKISSDSKILKKIRYLNECSWVALTRSLAS